MLYTNRWCPLHVGVAVLLLLAGCSSETFLNQTASVGGNVAGSAGDMEVIFINNTPFRAIFTYGTYNNTDQFSEPVAFQFVGNAGGVTLEAESTSPVITLPCDRVFSIGDSELLRLIRENRDDANTFDDEALGLGVGFSAAELGNADAGRATEGFSEPLRALLGVDFPCGSILVVRFEINDATDVPFRTDFEMIPPREDDRGL